MTHQEHDNHTIRKTKRKRERLPNSGKPRDWLNDSYDSVRGERALWIAVVTQAMMDALSRSRKPEDQFSKFEATRWLTGNSAHFKTVCMLAGLDPVYVRVRAKKALASNTLWRAEAGTGKRYEERKAYREKRKKEPRIPSIALPMLASACESFML
ncbi:MAG: hypothetical protein K2Q01_07875 [Rickettsiales bacterium]|nr:hypothetical protein [Rickettsiales bacterium]